MTKAPTSRPLAILRRLGLLVCVALLLFLTLVPVGRYLARAAWAEAGILSRRRPIARLVADPSTDAATRAKLELVQAARTFAVESLGLKAGESFTSYSTVPSDTLVLVLSGAYRDRLKAYSWWFPIVGRVPYKGFFDFAAARRAEQSLQRDGFDSYLRPASAFSTLGWFNDPLLSTSLLGDSIWLANTVIHELTHNTFYAPGQAVFNESFATFVGAHGGARFFAAQGDSARVRIGDARWDDEKTLGAFWEQVARSLDSAYAAHPKSRSERLVARDTVYARARATLIGAVGPRLHSIDARALPRVRLDNAALLARRIYLTGLDLFEDVYAREGRDLPRAVRRVIALARSRPSDPYGALRAWLATPASTAETTTQ